MWIFTPQGFLSIVADRENPREGQLLVRARNREHLELMLPDCEPFRKTPSDYPWRCWANRQVVAELLTRAAENLTYDNFKNAVEDPGYHDALLDVWTAMARYERRLAAGEWQAPEPLMQYLERTTGGSGRKAGRNGSYRRIKR